MSVKLSKHVSIEPCQENWFQMQGNDSVRFCSHCAKHVHNLTDWDANRVESWLEQQAGPVCVRVLPHRPRVPHLSNRRPLKTWLNRFFFMALGGLGLQAQTGVQSREVQQVTPLEEPDPEPILPSDVQLNLGPHRIFGDFSQIFQRLNEADPQPEPALFQVEIFDSCQQLLVRAGLDDLYRFQITGLASGIYELRLNDGEHPPQPLNLDLVADEPLEVDVVESYNLLYSVLGTVTYHKPDLGDQWLLEIHDSGPEMDPDEETQLKDQASLLNNVDLAEVKKMLANGDLNPTLGRSVGLTLLSYCLIIKKADAAMAFLASGADPHLVTFKGVPTFLFAAAMGEPTVIKKFLSFGVDPNVADAQGHTALMVAAFYGHAEALRVLIDAGADADQLDNKGFNALFYAEQNCQAELARPILARQKLDP